MEALILAAGEGRRMRPLTSYRPKPMLPLANKPILEHIITECSQAGVHDFIIVVGYQRESITGYFGDGSRFGVNICYMPQEIAGGTGDAVRMAQKSVHEKFLVMNGDVIIKKEDIARLIECNRITMAVKAVEDVIGLGVVQENGGLVQSLQEKPAGGFPGLANAGVYLMTRQIFPAIEDTPRSARGEYELTHSLGILIQQGVAVGCQTIDAWLNMTYPWDLLDASASLINEIPARNDGIVEEGAHIEGPCSIGNNTRIRSGAYILGPVAIGQNCDIGPNCFIRPSTTIGDSCHIGAAVEIKNSIIMQGTKIPHQSYVGDSIIGENCNLGAGTKIANLRFDHRNVTAAGLDTGRRKFGAILGDGVQTGINVAINAGTALGAGAFVWPGVRVSGNVEPGARVKI